MPGSHTENPKDYSELALEAATDTEFQQAVQTADGKINAIRAVRELLARRYPDVSDKPQSMPAEEKPDQPTSFRPKSLSGVKVSDQFTIAKDIVELISARGLL